ncbi:hypothetical protein [Gemmiger sp.]
MKKYLPVLLAATLALTACTAAPAETTPAETAPPAESVTEESGAASAPAVGTLHSTLNTDVDNALYACYLDSETHKYEMLRIDCAKAEQEWLCELDYESAYSCLTVNGNAVVIWGNGDKYGFTVVSPDGTTWEQPIDREFMVDVYDENAAYQLTSKSCLRLDLQTGEITQTDAPLTQLSAVYGLVENKVLISRYVTDTPLPDPNDMSHAEMYQAIIQNSMIEFDLYDVASNTIQKLFDWEYGSDDAGSAQYVGSRGGVVYFIMSAWDGNENSPTTNTLRGFDTAAGTWQDVHAENAAPGNFGTLGLTRGGQLEYAVLNWGTGTLVLYKLADGTTYEVSYSDNDGFPVALTEDGRVVVTDGRVANRGNDLGYGLIDENAYLAGSREYTKVKMWEG